MGLKIRLTRKTLKNHFRYYVWAYVVVLLAAGTIFNTVITSIKNQTPASERVFTVICGDFIPDARLQLFWEDIEKAFPDVKLISVENLPFNIVSAMSSTYKQKFLSYISSKFGDIMILPYTEFSDLAKYGTFIPLDEEFADVIKDLDPIGLKTVTMLAEGNDEAYVYGIPLNGFELFPYSYDTTDKVMVITSYSENKDDSISIAKWLLDYIRDKVWE